jgi:REP-associated tyrosine transposase
VLQSASWTYGHVFQGRYTAILVDRDAYLLELAWYVVLNPVRAGMVKSPQQWRWSSYAAMMGEVRAPEWRVTKELLRQFGRTTAQAREYYARFGHEAQTPSSLWNNLRNQMYLGDERFVAQMQSRIKDTGTLEEIPQVQQKEWGQVLHYHIGRLYSTAWRDHSAATERSGLALPHC